MLAYPVLNLLAPEITIRPGLGIPDLSIKEVGRFKIVLSAKPPQKHASIIIATFVDFNVPNISPNSLSLIVSSQRKI